MTWATSSFLWNNTCAMDMHQNLIRTSVRHRLHGLCSSNIKNFNAFQSPKDGDNNLHFS